MYVSIYVWIENYFRKIDITWLKMYWCRVYTIDTFNKSIFRASQSDISFHRDSKVHWTNPLSQDTPNFPSFVL